jgi:hypothetical protein
MRVLSELRIRGFLHKFFIVYASGGDWYVCMYVCKIVNTIKCDSDNLHVSSEGTPSDDRI